MLPDDGGPADAGAPVASVRTRSVIDAAKLLMAKERREQRLFLADGPQVVAEALAAAVVRQVFVADTASAKVRDLADAARDRGADVVVCDDPALSKVSGTQHPQGIVAVVEIPEPSFAVDVSTTRLIVALDRIADPGNLGTIIRTAAAAGADAVVLSPECVDPYNDKCVRSSTGSIFHVPVIEDVDLATMAGQCSTAGITVIVADAGGQQLDSPEMVELLHQPAMWIFGSEAHGISDQIRAAATVVAAVPHYGVAESLNVASAAAVCVFASAMAQRSRA
ncbi:MAG: hypothetical protein RL745_394 [Actinomycetota bacterium]